MIDLSSHEVWFVTGSQSLYGEEALQQVGEHARVIAAGLDAEASIPARVICKPVLTTHDAIRRLCMEADLDDNCIGLVTWMHTFSPARMWIPGLKRLRTPFVHLHTQFNRAIPWATIDMDFMNLNQSAHGGREFGFVGARLGLERTVVVGHWEDTAVRRRLTVWTRAAAAWHDAQHARIARFGDNMRNVAVTEGNKVSAEIELGYSVAGYGIGDLVERMEQVSDAEVEELTREYDDCYRVSSELGPRGPRRTALRDGARIELGLRRFLTEGGFTAFTSSFEVLHGMPQLPGLAVQRLMADGYGFGGEGDWKTAALVRAVKVMGHGLPGGSSFMEDYTYHFDGPDSMVLGAHMLELCPSIGDGRKASLEIHPLPIGGKSDPVRLVFTGAAGAAVNASLVDMGDRFRMVVNTVTAVTPAEELPRLPVARVLWKPVPNLEVAAAGWILAGGAHHTAYSQAIDVEYIEDFCDIAGIECLHIGAETRINAFKRELRWNEAYYRMAGARGGR
ncbi:MAG: L-arabinose isomerase [Spirochaetaceae bacterium]|nr:MAG: L-arabinose isomerase [Spirochaetaceae bacterium]